MYLKYVEMQGFKSFPDKMRFNFGKGVTAIVGPNGSGKSNVSDAIRWVLGEISSKSLRGTKMEDVIFSGAQGRSPSSYAEVSLCMDNSDGGLNDEHDEVIVTRHFSRSGNSEYYINKKEVRLKDIYELFLDTGIGRDGYSIIGQGQVSEILSPKSDTRREMIDEAAGISKFKHKKHEAEKNLSNTSDNLVRLNDILGEVTSRVEPARKEAEKTEKYLVLYKEARQLEVSLWMDEIDGIAGEKEKIQNAYNDAKRKLEICENEISKCETGTDELRERINKNNIEAEQNREDIKNHEHHMNELSEKKSVLQNDVEHYSERLSELNAQLNELNEHIKNNKNTFDAEHTKGDELDKKKTELQASINETESRINDYESKIFNMDFEVGNLALTKELTSDEINEQKLQLTVLSANAEQLKQRISQLKEEADSVESDDETKKKYENIKKQLSELALKRDDVNKKSADNLNVISSQNEIVETAGKELQQLLVKKAETDKHIDILNRMENMLEGYSNSVKAVMQAAKAGRISGIHGPVSKLIGSPEKYALALEVALGAQAQHIVTENEYSAKAGISELKTNKQGRATFLPLDTINGRCISAADIPNKTGYIGIASELVTYDRKYEKIVNYLLGRTVIADTIDSAAQIARSCSFKYKVVSLDGQVVNAGGSFTGGSISSKTGMFTRASDIEKLTKELEQTNLRISKLNDEISAAKKALENARNEAYGISEEKTRIQAGIAALEAEKSTLDTVVADDEQRRNNKNAEIDKLEKELSETSENSNNISLQIEKLAEKQKLDEQDYNAKKETLQQMQTEKDELKNKLYTMRIELAEVIKDIENYQYSIVSMAQTLELDTDKSNSLERQISEINGKLKTVKSEISSITDELEGGSEHYSAMQKNVARIDKENIENERKISEYSSTLRKCYSEKEILVRDFTKAEAKLENGEAEHDRLISRLFDTYDLTYTAAGEYRIVIENKGETTKRLSVLKADIKKLGSVNLNAVSEYAELKERYDFLSTQVGDLVKSKEQLEGIIKDLDTEMNRKLVEAMNSLNDNFARIFKELFGGGKAQIAFADEDIINGDIDIFAQPPGKTVNNIQLLSGGERSLISISLYFALISVSPTPFCIMDEIESALDDVNVDRFAQYAKRYCDKTQFIMITHRRGTMNVADILYGITMQEKGISKYLTISVDEVEQKLKIKL